MSNISLNEYIERLYSKLCVSCDEVRFLICDWVTASFLYNKTYLILLSLIGQFLGNITKERDCCNRQARDLVTPDLLM